MCRNWISVLVFAFFLVGCETHDSRTPSILLIAVDGLDFASVPCALESAEISKGLAEMCRESVRFTHAYTPSDMTQSALTSVFTGRYPIEHGVRHNGPDFLSEKVETVAEVAIRKNYRTGFFSGGTPVFHKSGLAQGFEVFDDNISLGLGRYYRPVQENFEAFLKWLDKEVSYQKYFATIFLADLQFTNFLTVDSLGEERSLSRLSQLQEIDESLMFLKKSLKSRGRWDNSYIILFGTQGLHKQKRSLHSDTTQITFMVKPARKVRDAGIEWSIDANVSLVDLGITLFELLGSKDQNFWKKSFGGVSLAESFKKPFVNWDKNRTIIIESSWAQWRELGRVQVAARKGQWLYLMSEKPLIYNTLTDAQEEHPLSEKELSVRLVQSGLRNSLNEFGYEDWQEPAVEELHRVSLLGRFHDSRTWSDEFLLSLRHLAKVRPWDMQIVGELAHVLYKNSKWKELKLLGTRFKQNSWVHFAKLKLGQVSKSKDACISLVFQKLLLEQSETDCKDPLVLAFAKYLRSRGSKKAVEYEAIFHRLYRLALIDREIAAINYTNTLSWDVSLLQPGAPILIDMILDTNHFQREKARLDRQMQRWRLKAQG